MLHLIKLSVGTEDIEDLGVWQARRLAQTGRVFHTTRMTPRRTPELLDGGSIYWVIKGSVQARQRLLAVEPAVNQEGRPCNHLILDPKLVRTAPRAHRAFQGWRYLEPADAPPDLEAVSSGLADMPPEMAAALRELGLI